MIKLRRKLACMVALVIAHKRGRFRAKMRKFDVFTAF